MAIAWMSYFFYETSLAGSDLLVALAIADHANPDGYARPGMATLAGKTRLDVRQVRRVIRRLEASGYLATRFRPGRGHLPEFQLEKRSFVSAIEDEQKGTPGTAISDENRTPTTAFKKIKADKSAHKSGQIVSKNGLHIRIEPNEPFSLDQLIDACAKENPEADKRIVAIGTLQTLLRAKDANSGPINSLKYFGPEINRIREQVAGSGLSSEALDALYRRRLEQYNAVTECTANA